MTDKGFLKRIKEVLIGKGKSLVDPDVFHKLALVAFLGWVGLGADGLSSSCYGPEEAFLALGQHTYLGIFVAVASAITVIIIAASYSQIIELFPSGGGGYLVASKLLSPGAGLVAGSALIIDYVLTISLSIASGTDAVFSFLPGQFIKYKFWFAAFGILVLIILNMRGLKESITVLTPIFLLFLLSHAGILIYGIFAKAGTLGTVMSSAVQDAESTGNALGFGGMILLLLRAYSMGAGTYTGIEAVSNGMNTFREPRIHNAKKTMDYMAVSLCFMVLAIMVSYVIYRVTPVPGKTLNAVLFESVTENWGTWGRALVYVLLFSEGALLFVAAQTGFIDGPRVLSNMAKDRWFPSRFAMLSDRLVAQNGILLMGGAAFVTLFITGGSVKALVVLYSINVFITFSLSQLGMVVHWWQERKAEKKWKSRLAINLTGLILTTFILFAVTIIKFSEGGWMTVFITGVVVAIALFIKQHYKATELMLKRLDVLMEAAALQQPKMFLGTDGVDKRPPFDASAKTAVLFVNGFNGLGLHTLLTIPKLFGETFKNYVFVEIGVVDTGNFKGAAQVENLSERIKNDVDGYVEFMANNGHYAEGFTAIGTDVIEEAMKIAPVINNKYADPIYFGGQLVFENETAITRVLHNYVVFQMQRLFYHKGTTFVILPIRVY